MTKYETIAVFLSTIAILIVRGKMNLPSHGKEFFHPAVRSFLHTAVSAFLHSSVNTFLHVPVITFLLAR
jgi:hypothetical protein